MELKQSLKLSQQLILTPQLQQAIKLLQVTRMELMDVVSAEIEENPLLEIDTDDDQQGATEEITETDSLLTTLNEKVADISLELTGDKDGKDDFDWGSYLEDSATPNSVVHYKSTDEETTWDNFLVKTPTLAEHLLWQLTLAPLNDEEFCVGEVIIMNIDDDGYLRITTDEIATCTNSSLEMVEKILEQIQDFDPAGIASRNLKECLLLQSKAMDAGNIVSNIIEQCLKELELRNYQQISKKLHISKEATMAGIKIIRTMNPKPGSIYSEEKAYPVIPDVFIIAHNGEYKVVLNEEGMPKLRINDFYRETILSSAVSAEKNDNKKYINERMQSAKWFIKSLEQRQNTIRKVVESIVKFQKDFFNNGAEYLKPLVLRDIADDVEMHESTISRVVSNKYVLTPRGTFLLKHFFSSALNTSVVGEMVASSAVKEEIKKILLEENQHKPYNDSQISMILKAKGIRVARRTVAKYREMMNILPSSSRKSF